jgi:hypothetical protein
MLLSLKKAIQAQLEVSEATINIQYFWYHNKQDSQFDLNMPMLINAILHDF